MIVFFIVLDIFSIIYFSIHLVDYLSAILIVRREAMEIDLIDGSS